MKKLQTVGRQSEAFFVSNEKEDNSFNFFKMNFF